MEQPRPTRFTADEFIVWALEQPSGRFELTNGTVVAMAPERASHNQAKLNAVIALRGAIGARGVPCRAMTDGMAVRIDDRTVYEPDALVRCGSPLPGDAIQVADPIIVVEVVSPSSGGVDLGAKLAGYFSLPSVLHYLIVDTDRRVVIHNAREPGRPDRGPDRPRRSVDARPPRAGDRRPGHFRRYMKSRQHPATSWEMAGGDIGRVLRYGALDRLRRGCMETVRIITRR